MARNGALGIAALVLLAGSLLLLWFIILSGVKDTTPLDKIYFLRADTSGITGARDITQWTYFYFCGEGNNDCGKARPAPAFGRAWDSNAQNVPSSLIGGHAGDTTSSKFFFLWRFGWVFFLITLFFETLAFFSGFLACCGRLGSAISAMIAIAALFCSSVAMSLMTATFVLARNAFTGAGRSASLGRYAFGFGWGSWAALFLATVLFCLGMRGDKDKGYSGRRWRRRRSVRSADYSGRRVKDEYSQREQSPPSNADVVENAEMSGGTGRDDGLMEEPQLVEEHLPPGVHFNEDVGRPVVSPLSANPPSITTHSLHNTNEAANTPVRTSAETQSQSTTQAAFSNDTSGGPRNT